MESGAKMGRIFGYREGLARARDIAVLCHAEKGVLRALERELLPARRAVARIYKDEVTAWAGLTD